MGKELVALSLVELLGQSLVELLEEQLVESLEGWLEAPLEVRLGLEWERWMAGVLGPQLVG